MEVRSLISSLVSLVIPVQCLSCSVADKIICTKCANNLLSQSPQSAITLARGQMKMRIAAQLPFSSVVSKVVLGAKDDENPILERLIIDALVRARSCFVGDVALVPIPSTTRARRKRGRDFVFDLTHELAERSGDLVIPLISYRRKVLPQKSLNAHDRAINLKDAFTVRAEIADRYRAQLSAREILIVDDVLTTGATMLEGFRAVKAVGARCLGGISAAYSLNWRMSRSAH